MSDNEKLRGYLRWVTADLQRARRRLDELDGGADDPVAVVGMACRFPGGVESPEGLWDLVVSGGDGVGEFPGDRGWDLAALFDPDPDRLGCTYARAGGFLDRAAEFDAEFFGVSPREALAMDPQQRLLLEVSWEALERVGIDPTSVRGSRTGVFVGAFSQYYESLLRDEPESLEGFVLTGSAGSVVSGRVSYTLGLEGPAVTVDTACSSSLVAMHLAGRSLRSGECDLVLAGGVTVMATPSTFVEFSRQRGLAPDGRSKPFSAHADGAGFAEGVGVVVLERLSDARRHGRRVLAVVRGSAVNQDGASNGLTAPNGPAQQRVIRAALADAGLSAADVDVVEAHGTGTRLGDPIEAQALLATYGQRDGAPLWLGSVKANIGHTQAAAGVAGVIKMVMALRHGVVPRSPHCEQPSAEVDWSTGAVSLLTENVAWPAGDRPRRAAVSSFGISGTNAHLVLEEPPQSEHRPEVDPPRNGPAVVPWVVSGHGEEGLRAAAGRLAAFAASAGDGIRPVDVAWSLLGTRAGLRERAVVLGRDRDDVIAGLSRLAAGEPAANVVRGTAHTGGLVGVLSGQGGLRIGAGSSAWRENADFAREWDEVRAVVEEFTGPGLADALWSGHGTVRDRWAQPALFALQVSLGRVLARWGVRPRWWVGHSVGEFAAVHLAGAMSLSDAARLVAARGRMMASLPAGGVMVAVRAGAAEVADDLSERVELAAVNAPDWVVLSGDCEPVTAVAEAWRGRGRKVRALDVDHAFHSFRMDPMLAELAAAAGAVSWRPPDTLVVSTVTGRPLTFAELSSPDHWVRHARHTVRFADAIRWVADQGAEGFLELGPDATLSPLAQQCLPPDRQADVPCVPVLRADRPDHESLTAALAELHVNGHHVDWDVYFRPFGPQAVELPTYPFRRRRYWPRHADEPRRAPASPATDARDEPVPTREVPPKPVLLALVCDHAAAVLGHRPGDSVDGRGTFRDLGFDSLTGVRFSRQLSRALGCTLPATLIFDHPTPQDLVEHLHGRLIAAEPEYEGNARHDEDPIVVVGLGCRFPGGIESPEGLWDLAVSGGDGIVPFPRDRGWDVDALFDPEPGRPGSTYVRAGGFLAAAAEFDAEFFGVSPREALAMDPQQRLLLEVSWEALERAGIDPTSVRGSRTGVFTGIVYHDYATRCGTIPDHVAGYVLTGGAASVASGRVAYTLGLEGPAITVDTACSSSLVAMHLAVRSLRDGETDLALAGGATVMPTPLSFVEFSRQRGLAPDGRCKPFSAAADGTAWGEGVGVVALERLSDARRHGRRVLAVVRGSAVNQDGASNGLTAPNGPSQQRVIRAALADAGLSAADVDVVEAHGTGTRLGDPIEAQALLATYGQRDGAPLWLGSVKANIGHTQAAAGVAGVVKMVMAMRQGVVPQSLHCEQPSAEVDWTAGSVALPVGNVDWPSTGRPRRAAVSSFGMSGTNAHLILEQPDDGPIPDRADRSPGVLPWVVSGRSAAGLRAVAERMAAHVSAHPDVSPADLGWSLARGRAGLEHRAVVLGADRAELLAGLSSLAEPPDPTDGPPVVSGVLDGSAAGGVVLVFPGQGGQWAGMAQTLLASSEVFARRWDECREALSAWVSWSLSEVVDDEGALSRVDVVQPVLWAVMVSLAEVWRSWGVEPVAVIGHSQGEIAAACVAGVLSLGDGARVVAVRSRLLAGLAGRGGMVAVSAPVEVVRAELARWGGRLSVAAVNGPASVVVSGAAQALGEAVEHWERSGVRVKRVPVDYASHTDHVDAVREELLAELAGITPVESDVVCYSGLFGGSVRGGGLDADYWFRNLREPVLFADAVQAASAAGHRTFVEVGPHPVLVPAMQEVLDGRDALVLGSLRRGKDGLLRLLTSLSELYVRGHTVDWAAVFRPHAPRVVDLPTYPFSRRHFWLDAPATADVASVGLEPVEHPVLGAVIGVPDEDGWVFSGRLSARDQPWLPDHAVHGVTLFPGTGFVELVSFVGARVELPMITELALHTPLVIPVDGAVAVRVRVGAEQDGSRTVTVHSRPEHAGPHWTRHATATLGRPADHTDLPAVPAPVPAIDVDRWYEDLAAKGYGYGTAFRTVRGLLRTGADTVVEATSPHDAGAFGVHPALLDAALQVVAADTDEVRLPFGWRGVSLAPARSPEIRVRIHRLGPDEVSLTGVDATGAVVLSVASLVFRTADRALLGAPRDGLHRVRWTPVETPRHEVAWAEYEEGSAADVAVLRCGLAGSTSVAQDVHTEVRRVLAVLKTWLGDRPAGTRLVLRTRGAVDAAEGDEVTDLAAAAVWGLTRSAQAENPGRLTLVDLDDDPASTAVLAAALTTGESQFAVRRGQVLVPALVDTPPQPVPTAGQYLDVERRGDLDSLVWRDTCESEALEPGQVLVEVRATGLNFRDVLNTLGLYPGPNLPLGLEGAGVVVEVGPGVTHVAPGDRVLGLFRRAFGPTTVTDHRLLAPMPDSWSFVHAASVPVVFLTAYHGLRNVAGLRRGESVLVHAAAGGVGMAAVQLARHWGARVYATASPDKWPSLRALGLDDRHLASSRTTEFEQRFRAAGGIDVVLNSLTGEFTDASLRLLAPGGRVVEIGKTDIRDPEQVAAAHRGAAYHPFDLGEVDPDLVRRMLLDILELFERGALRPLPVRCWDVRQASTAFRHLSRARHVGKVVLTSPRRWDPAGTLLVTGGLGVLGGLLARHLVDTWGVRHVVLLGRRGGPNAVAEELTARGVSVRMVRCDVADREALRAVVEAIPTLRGVVHAAGVLRDGVLGSLTEDQVAQVLRPKVDGAWHLHELTAGLDLSAFVLFSSAAGVLGGQGQANYAAANAFLDALAQFRAARGLPATSLAWGLWQLDSGLTAHLGAADRARMSRSGVLPLRTDEGFALFDAAVATGRPALVPTRWNIAALARQADGGVLPALLRGLVGAPGNGAAPDRPRPDLGERLAALSEAERQDTLLEVVRQHAASVLGHPSVEVVDPHRAFKELGFDSLVAVEFRNRLNSATGLSLPVTVAFDHPTLAALAAELGTHFAPAEPAPRASALDEVERLVRGVGDLVPRDAGERAEIVLRLEGLLVRWKSSDDEVAQDLSAASDEEIFAFIRQEFGKPSDR
ncbi:acyl transferase domain-containing protein/NADPH:quinone reductase-like Zn-dependent oxidoreductase/acyl carrier protein [Embleya sp. AB8]